MDRATLLQLPIDELRRLAGERGIGSTDELDREQLVSVLATWGSPSSTTARPRNGGRLDVPSSIAPARPTEHDPEDMARLYIEQGSPERAADIWRRLLAVSPSDPHLARKLAEAEDAILARVPPEERPQAGERERSADERARAEAEARARIAEERRPSAQRIVPGPGEPFGMLDLEEPPEGYGVDECELIARDPFHLFTYWEVTERALTAARSDLAADAEGARLVLRVFTTTDKGTARETRDHELGTQRGRRYLPSPRAGVRVRAAVGLVSRSGLFAPVAHSSTVRVPPAEPAAPSQPDWIEVLPVGRGETGPAPIQIVRGGEVSTHGERALPGTMPVALPSEGMPGLDAEGHPTSPTAGARGVGPTSPAPTSPWRGRSGRSGGGV